MNSESSDAVSSATAESESRTAPIVAGLALFGMIACMSLAYGFQYLSDEGAPLGYFLPFSLVYFLCLAGLVAASLRRSATAAGGGQGTATIAGLALMSAALAMTLYFYSGALPFPALPAIGALMAAVVGAAAIAGARRATALVLLLGLALQAALAVGNPLDVAAANMLPVIEAGCSKLFHGENPYLAEYPGITSVPLLYLPGLFLPYCAPVAAGLDVRLVNVVLMVAIVGYAAWALDFRNRPERLSLGLLPLLLSPAAGQMMIHGHVWSYWLLVVVFVHALARHRFVAAALLLGLMLATRQMSLFLAIPAAAYMSTRLTPFALLRYGVIAVATYFAIMTPVMLTTPNWIDLFYLSIQRLGEQTHLTYGNPMNQVSLSGLLTAMGFADALRPLQTAVLLATAGAFWIWRRRLRFDHAIILLGASYLLIIGLNEFLHRYFYFPGLILLALGIALTLEPAAASPGPLRADDGTRRSG